MHKCFWKCWPSKNDLEEPLLFQTWPGWGIREGREDIERRAPHSASTVPDDYNLHHPPEVDSSPATDSTVNQIIRQQSIDSSIDFDSDEETPTLLVQTSDGASQHDCVRSSTDMSPVRSPQDADASGGKGKRGLKGRGLDAESRDVMRALPPASELRFANMVAVAKQAAAVALSETSPRVIAADCGKTPRQLSTPRTSRTPRSGRTGSKRDRPVTSSKKKKVSSKTPRADCVHVY